MISPADGFIERHWLGASGAVLAVLAPSLRRQRAQVVTVMVLVVLAVSLGVAVPHLVQALLTDATAGLLVLFVLVLAADPVVSYLVQLRTTKISLNASSDLRMRVFVGINRTRMTEVDASVRAYATAHTGADVDRVEKAFESMVFGGFAGVLRVAASLGFLAWINTAAAVVMACLMLAFFFAQRRLAGRLVTADLARQASTEQVATIVDESVTAVATSRGLAVGSWFGRRLAVRADRLDELSYEQLRLDAQLRLSTRIVALVGLAAVTLLGVSNERSAGELLAALLYIELGILGLESLPPMLRALQQGEASVVRLRHDLAAGDELVEGPGGPPVDSPGGSGSMTLIGPDGDQNEIRPGTWVVVVDGSNGDPSSWLGGLQEPSTGRVLVDGMPATLAVRARSLASVTSDARCVDASVIDHLRAVAPGLSDGEVVELLKRLGIGHLSDMQGGGLEAPLGVQGALLSSGERQRLLIAMALAGGPAALVLGRLRPLADPDVARPIITELRRSGATLLTVSGTEAVAAEADLVLFVTPHRWHLGPHHELLMGAEGYVERWHHGSGDTASFGALASAGPLEREALQSRMVTERYEPGDTIYREGAPADRVVFVVSGHVEIVGATGTPEERRLAVIEAGNACGDLRLTPNERRAETARAMDFVVVRTIGRAVWETGMAGLLHADPCERRVIASILRFGALRLDEVVALLPEDDPAAITAAVGALLGNGALRQRPTGELTAGASKRRASRSSAGSELLDRLAGT